MANTQIAPVWTDRDSCFRCHTNFSAFTRKHHCRACGETFCSACSSKQCPILDYGIEDEVRVCESCYDRITTTGSVRPPASIISQGLSTSKPKGKTQDELDEEEALQLAISLSQSEAAERERQKKLLTQQYATMSTNIPSAPAPVCSAPIADQNDSEQRLGGSELAKYLDRNYWQSQAQKSPEKLQTQTETTNQYVSDEQIDSFISAVNEHINNIKFRMLSNQQRGRNIANDTAVQSVFLILQHMHPELHQYIKALEDKQAYYESLQDKLGQLKDAREVLNALRDEHQENKRRQAMERERQRQIQLAVKLEDLRQKKQAYLEYQRQLHLQSLAEQEAEMQARLDQQRRYAQQREQQNQMDYRLNQLPYISSAPSFPSSSSISSSSSIGYYQQTPQIHPMLASTAHSFSMGQLSQALPTSSSLIPPMVQPTQASFALQASMPSNEQTLISFD